MTPPVTSGRRQTELALASACGVTRPGAQPALCAVLLAWFCVGCSPPARDWVGASASGGAGTSSDANGGSAGAPRATKPKPPTLLSGTGLFARLEGTELELWSDVEEYAPRFPLFSDGAEKTRWAKLPADSVIDQSDPDHWSFPVGTRLWKEFKIDGRRIETRMIERFGAADDDFAYSAYAWLPDGSDAELVPARSGMLNALGSGHDIPTEDQCRDCHGYLKEHVLGFSAVQLNHTGPGLTLPRLAEDARLLPSDVPVADIPGDTTTVAALGYLHANCGHCHNASGVKEFKHPLDFRLSTRDVDLQSTGAYRTAVGQPVELSGLPASYAERIQPGAPDKSAVVFRMSTRRNLLQMPPLGANLVDADGRDLMIAWVNSLATPTN